MLNRVNRFTGVAYKNDPTIFAFDLINEPRGDYSNAADDIDHWVNEMATYAKSMGARQMVTVGEEGFYAYGEVRQRGCGSEWYL